MGAIVKRVAAAAAGATLGVALCPQPVAASNWFGASGSSGCFVGQNGNRADNKTHTFFYNSLESQMVTEVNDYRAYLRNNTAVTDETVSTLTSLTDANLLDANYTTTCGYTWDSPSFNMWGLAACLSVNSASECERHDVRFDTSDYAFLGPDGREALACHEVGHSLGLMHTSDTGSCMLTADNTTVRTYTQHDKDHLANGLV